MEQLLRGIYQAVRNPRSHGKVIDTEEDSQAIILLVNYLVKLVGQYQTPFSKTRFVARVFDPDFVASERYAQLLVNEIPARKRLEIFFEVYRVKCDGEGVNLRFFFDVLLAKMEDDERKSVYDAISDELKHTDDETTIKRIIQAFDPDLWPLLDEAARLRIENKLVRSIRSGKYVAATNKCHTGSFGTWATRLFPHFTLKTEAFSTIYGKLKSKDRTGQDYGFTYLFSSVDSLRESPPKWFDSFLVDGLKSGDRRFYDALNYSFLWNDQKWSPELTKAVDNFQEVEPAPELTDDDIPF